MTVTILPYDERYRDDMIFMVLEAKEALGRAPRLNEDLLAVKESYLDRGFGFWLALDESGRVVGCVGWRREDSGEAFLHRLYVKASCKRQGVGSRLLAAAEAHMRTAGVSTARVHLGEPREQWFESYAFYPKHGYTAYAPRYMRKEL